MDIKSDILGLTKRNIEKSTKAGKETDNVRIFAYDIERILQVFDSNDVVDRIYINFCNPWPKKNTRKRDDSIKTAVFYQNFENGGEIWFKTDDDELFESR